MDDFMDEPGSLGSLLKNVVHFIGTRDTLTEIKILGKELVQSEDFLKSS